MAMCPRGKPKPCDSGSTSRACWQRCSTRLLNLPPGEVDQAIVEALGRLGAHLDMDRATIGTAGAGGR